MALGSVNVPGALGRELKEADRALEARIASTEKTLSGMEKIPGSGPPTSQVIAKVGQIYINVVTGEQWKCVAVSDSGSAWEKITGSGTALSAADVGAVPVTGGTMTGPLVLDGTGVVLETAYPHGDVGFRIGGGEISLRAGDNAHTGETTVFLHGIHEPWNDTDAANRGYVDGKVAAVTPGSIGAAPAGHTHTAAQVGARPSTWMPTAAEVGAVPTTRKVNNKPLSGDITLSAADVGARPSSWTPTAADVGAKASTWAPFHIGASAPSDKTQLWIDTTASTGGLKYWDGSAWKHVPVAYT